MYAFIAVHLITALVFSTLILMLVLYCKLCCKHWHPRLYYAILSASVRRSLEQSTLPPRLDGLHGTEHGADGLIEHRLQPLLCQRRAFQVLHCADLFRHTQTLCVGDGREFLVLQLLNGVLVFAKIQLGADQDDGRRRAVMPHFGEPLSSHVFE